MNILAKTTVAIAMAVAAISSAAANSDATATAAQSPSVCCAGEATALSQSKENGIFDLLSPELIKVYEENVSRAPVVSDISPARLKRMAQKYGCGEKKMCALVVVRDMAARAGGSVSLAELSKESDLALVKRAKQYADVYIETLSDAEKKDLEAKFKEALKDNPSLSFLK